jgi:hypothetical protein
VNIYGLEFKFLSQHGSHFSNDNVMSTFKIYFIALQIAPSNFNDCMRWKLQFATNACILIEKHLGTRHKIIFMSSIGKYFGKIFILGGV